ncbi:MAG: hypothetical protein WBF34_11310 [Streptosporangiaceae bacterium]|jgi:hypothetical protein
MKYYMDKVILPRPTFAADMTETESAIMSKHVAYWTVPEASGHPIGPSAAAGSPR